MSSSLFRHCDEPLDCSAGPDDLFGTGNLLQRVQVDEDARILDGHFEDASRVTPENGAASLVSRDRLHVLGEGSIKEPSDLGSAARTPAPSEVLMPSAYAGFTTARAPSNETRSRTRSASWPRTTMISSTRASRTIARTCSSRDLPPSMRRGFGE